MSTKLRTFCDLMALHNEVTGSCHLLSIKFPNNERIRLIVDCGLFQGETDDQNLNKEFPFKADKIDGVLVTHNHVDHTGRLPLLVKQGYRKDIYCTDATKALMPLALADSCKVLKDLARRNNCKQLYTETDVNETISQLKAAEFGKTFKIHKYVKCTLFMNGHLLGAALILLQIQYENEDAVNLLFTGDYNNKNMFFDVENLPNWVKELPLTVISEATYGDKNSSEIVPVFKENVKNKMKTGGTLIIPVFSLGRSQEILKTLREMQDAGEVESSVPIYFDGKLAVKYTQIYLKDGLRLKDDCLDFLPNNLVYVDEEIRDEILNNTQKKKVIVTTSGSGGYGPAPMYFQKYIGNSNAMIHFTGFLFEGSLGRALRDTTVGEYVKINGILIKKFANVESTSEFSAHAKADEMIAFLQQFKDLKSVLVNHGEINVKDKFAERVADKVKTKDVAVLDREYFLRLSPYGIEKSVPTKFV